MAVTLNYFTFQSLPLAALRPARAPKFSMTSTLYSRFKFIEQVNELKERAKDIPDDYFIVLVGNMISEETLPTFQALINGIEIFHDKTGSDNTPWATWTRGWSAEENRHGDLLNKYLYLSRRVDMNQVEKTTHYMIRSGMDVGTRTSPYFLTIYTSFQERVAFISHGNTAKLAKKHGDKKLAQICGTIAADEKRHEIAYTKIVEKLFELDPNETVIAFADIMRRKILMPAHLIYDGYDENLFDHFANVASRIGVYRLYTVRDYGEILEHLVAKWNIEKLTGLSGEDEKPGLCMWISSKTKKARGKSSFKGQKSAHRFFQLDL